MTARRRRSCSVEGCERPHYGNGYCQLHNQAYRRAAGLLVCKLDSCNAPSGSRGYCGYHLDSLAPTGRCTVANCSAGIYARELCRKHYSRMLKTGTTESRHPHGLHSACWIEGCDARVMPTIGLCSRHEKQRRAAGTPFTRRELKGLSRVLSRVCRVDGCESEPSRQDLCAPHYARQLKYGDPLGGQRGFRNGTTRCKVDGCDNPGRYIKCMCSAHYAASRKLDG